MVYTNLKGSLSIYSLVLVEWRAWWSLLCLAAGARGEKIAVIVGPLVMMGRDDFIILHCMNARCVVAQVSHVDS